MNLIELQQVQQAVMAARARCKDPTIVVHWKGGEYLVLREVYNLKGVTPGERAAVLEHVALSGPLALKDAVELLGRIQ